MNSLLSIINKYGKDGIINNVPQAELMEALMEISNSSQKVSRKSKKPHDPNAPKRPTSGYMFWLNENRTYIKETYFNDFEQIDDWSIKFKTEYYLSKGLNEPDKDGKPRIVTLITTKAGLLWKDLEIEDKQPYEDKFKLAQEEYATLKTSYIPSLYRDTSEILIEVPEGWGHGHSGMSIDKTIKDEHGKTIRIFNTFTDAIKKAESLGIQCYGITQTKRGFSVRTGNLKKCDKSISSWTKLDFVSPIKSKRGRPKGNHVEDYIKSTKESTKELDVNDSDADADSDADSDDEMLVQEITIKGNSYYLNAKTKDVFDPNSSECLGKYINGKIVVA